MKKQGRLIGYIRPRVEGMDRKPQLHDRAADEVFTEAPDARTYEAQVQLHECLDRLSKGDTLLVESMSCLTRNFRDMEGIARRVHDVGAAIHFIQEDLIFNAYPDREEQFLSMAAISAFANSNREFVKERKLEAFAKAKDEGRHIGRPPRLSKEQRAEIKRRIETGEKIPLLAKEFGVSPSTIYDIKAGR